MAALRRHGPRRFFASRLARETNAIPAQTEKLLLSESGLREKALEWPLAGNKSAMRSVIIQSFSQLPRNGYTICRRVGGGRKSLQILEKALSIGQAKCYLRSIANDLDL